MEGNKTPKINLGASQTQKSNYGDYLPESLQNQPILNGFLLAFEEILSGVKSPEISNKPLLLTGNQEPVGLEQIIAQMENYFKPETTPEEFLPWLASWVALSLQEDWELEFKRKFIRSIVNFYRQRGTKTGLAELLQLYVHPELDLEKEIEVKQVKIYENFDIPHYFQVEVNLKSSANLELQKKNICAIINREKPAHTSYALKLLFPTMQIRNIDKDEKIKEEWGKIQPSRQSTKKEELIKKAEEVSLTGLWLGINSKLGTSDKPETKNSIRVGEQGNNEKPSTA